MKCVEAEKTQACEACGRTFAAGELIYQHTDGLFCIKACFTKDLGSRRKEPTERKVVNFPRKAGQSSIIKTLYPEAIEIPIQKPNELEDVMGGKLKRDINKLGRRKA